jgi:hypothetical protein
VVLPPGRAKLATKPAPTGSITFANTIGTVRVTRCSAATFTLAEAKMTSGASATNSAAYLFESAGLPAVQRISTRIGPAQFLQPLEECPDASLPFRIVLDRRHKQADAPCGLLRAHSERPGGCRAPEKRDELAPPHGFSLIENHTLSHRRVQHSASQQIWPPMPEMSQFTTGRIWRQVLRCPLCSDH